VRAVIDTNVAMTLEGTVGEPMNDLVLGATVISAAVVSAIGAVWTSVWTYVTTKDLKHVESRLRRDEEEFRLVHSPRVTAAIELWAALCEYERRVNAFLVTLRAPLGLPEDQARAIDEQLRGAREREKVELKQSWFVVNAARDRAEVLIDTNAFKALDTVFRAYTGAATAQRSAERLEARRANPEPSYDRLIAQIEKAEQARPEALLALRQMIGVDKTRDGRQANM